MLWIRSAILYIAILGVIAGAVWLFWGKSIETAWKSHGEKPAKTAREAKAAAEKKIVKALPEMREKTAPLSANLEKAKSGVAGIMAHQIDENRRGFTLMAAQNDKRWLEILRRGAKLPPAPSTSATGAKPAQATTKPLATDAMSTEEKKRDAKRVAPRRSKPLEVL